MNGSMIINFFNYKKLKIVLSAQNLLMGLKSRFNTKKIIKRKKLKRSFIKM